MPLWKNPVVPPVDRGPGGGRFRIHGGLHTLLSRGVGRGSNIVVTSRPFLESRMNDVSC